MVYCCSKSPHQLQVEVAVIFISCSVDDIEITKDEPFGFRQWL